MIINYAGTDGENKLDLPIIKEFASLKERVSIIRANDDSVSLLTHDTSAVANILISYKFKKDTNYGHKSIKSAYCYSDNDMSYIIYIMKYNKKYTTSLHKASIYASI